MQPANSNYYYYIFFITLVSPKAQNSRDVPKAQNSRDVEVKQPEFLFKSLIIVSPNLLTIVFLIPGIGRVLVPPPFRVPSYDPYTGTGGYLPCGDDIPVPNPGRVGSVSAVANP
ncbi:hypothetical protein P3X46_012319 [Hevea brasiliensis]|uniref:Transmembrane protein n=1 Tax=Hevea brasiliensis TaxID=3981 RepID=A0ABQ9MDH5_HEVBR|nr:hypothetical protein P3X46_012319 [Hevea brasiliensis]